MIRKVITLTQADFVKSGLPALPAGSLRYAVRMTGIEPASSYDVLKDLNEKVWIWVGG
jgi:hypothetical protein